MHDSIHFPRIPVTSIRTLQCVPFVTYTLQYFFIFFFFFLFRKSGFFLLTYLSSHQPARHFCSVNLYSELLVLVIAFFYTLEFLFYYFHKLHFSDTVLFTDVYLPTCLTLSKALPASVGCSRHHSLKLVATSAIRKGLTIFVLPPRSFPSLQDLGPKVLGNSELFGAVKTMLSCVCVCFISIF